MTYRKIPLKSVYQSGLTNLLEEFYIPVLKQTIRYDRAAGYFRSGIIQHIGHSLIHLVKNRGKIRLITGVEFSEEDLQQIQKGYELRDVITNRLSQEVDDMTHSVNPELLNLWWLIKNNYLDIKISVSVSGDSGIQRGIYHEKFGVLEDLEGKKIVFAGSINESANGWKYNFESFDVFRDWYVGEDDRVRIREENFEHLWHNQMPGVTVMNFPEALRKRIVELAPPELIRNEDTSSQYKSEQTIFLRDYQIEAIESWFRAGKHGILEMATGTGKTITSLFAAKKLLQEIPNTNLLILCPYTHLVEQWSQEASKFGFHPLMCYGSIHSWKKSLISLLADYKSGRINHFCIISTMDTASSLPFLELMQAIQDQTMLLADEMHNLGSGKRRNALLPRSPYRLGLSATPQRWMDEEGSELLFEYFGDVIFRFGLAEAIQYGYLTPYDYFPIPVEFTFEEWEDYEALSSKISKLAYSNDPDNRESMERLLLKRARLANSASSKVSTLKLQLQKQESIHHTLIYTSPQLIDDVLSLTKEFSLYATKFTSEESMAERKLILEMFATRKLDVVVAMKCLDEGVDVPSTQKAFILASSSNPKEFIQRRGRILRKSNGKTHAVLYDFIVIPPTGTPISNSARALVKKELARFREFSETAKNQYEAKYQLSKIAKRYNVLGEI